MYLHLSLRYREGLDLVLRDVTLEVAPGEKVDMTATNPLSCFLPGWDSGEDGQWQVLSHPLPLQAKH